MASHAGFQGAADNVESRLPGQRIGDTLRGFGTRCRYGDGYLGCGRLDRIAEQQHLQGGDNEQQRDAHARADQMQPFDPGNRQNPPRHHCAKPLARATRPPQA